MLSFQVTDTVGNLLSNYLYRVAYPRLVIRQVAYVNCVGALCGKLEEGRERGV